MPERHLKAVEEAAERLDEPYVIVNPRTGEQVGEVVGDPRGLAAELAQVVDERDGLVETVRSQAAKLRALRRDRERDARSSELWPAALEAFEYWKAATGHARTRFTADRFYLLEPYLERDGLDLVLLAIDGAAHDPYRADRPNRNGIVEVYDSLETIFKTRASFERHANRAPRERIRQVREAGGMEFPYSELELRVKAEVLALTTGDQDVRDPGARAETALERARAELEGRRRPDVSASPPANGDGRGRLFEG